MKILGCFPRAEDNISPPSISVMICPTASFKALFEACSLRALRLERRIEFAWEGRRFWDLHRWRFFEEAFIPYYGHHPYALLKERVVDAGLWFWPWTPEIDENGIPDFDPMFEAGLISLYVERHFESKQYLWPIPNTEVLINENIDQNPLY